jgi:hypothetical protein
MGKSKAQANVEVEVECMSATETVIELGAFIGRASESLGDAGQGDRRSGIRFVVRVTAAPAQDVDRAVQSAPVRSSEALDQHRRRRLPAAATAVLDHERRDPH